MFTKNYHSMRCLISALRTGQDSPEKGLRQKDEEQRTKAIKVVDLLHHSVELGSMDALYTLAKISLVSTFVLCSMVFRLNIAMIQLPPTQHFPSDPTLAYESFSKVASQTGNESAQAYLAFFYATGYHNVVPVDQAKAQLYLTFAANGGDRGAEMALGYRYWSGIGVSDSCQSATFWYSRAAEKGSHAVLINIPVPYS